MTRDEDAKRRLLEEARENARRERERQQRELEERQRESTREDVQKSDRFTDKKPRPDEQDLNQHGPGGRAPSESEDE